MRRRFFSRAASGASLWWTGLLCIALAFGCGDVNGTDGNDSDMPGAHLELPPSDAMVPIITRSDATGSVSFSVAHARSGALSGRALTMTGNTAGKTGVIENTTYPACGTVCTPSTACTQTCVLPNFDTSTCGQAGLVCSPAIGPMSPGVGVDWALASNGATVTASSQMNGAGWQGPASAAIDGDRIGGYWWNSLNNYAGGAGWNDNTPGVWPDWLEVDFAGPHTINEIDVFTVQTEANYQSFHVPTPSDLSTAEGLIDYQMQYCPTGTTCTNSSTAPYGTGWLDVTLGGVDVGHITNNSNTWRHVVFDAVQTDKIRILTNNGYANSSRIVEVEAWDTTAIGKNWALAANGATATVSSSYSSTFGPGNAIDGDRSAWGYPNGPQAMWCSAQTPSASSPDIYAVTFASTASISEIDLFGQQDAKTAAVVPTFSLGSTLFAFQDYQVQYCPAGTTCSAATTYPGTGWVDVGATPASSTAIWNQVNFPAVQTEQIRVVFTSIANNDYTRIAEIEAWDYSNASGARSPDYATAISLRRQMVGPLEGCGAPQPTTIGSASGEVLPCIRNWISWSASTGAWDLLEGNDSGLYFDGAQNWPSTATTAMANLGFQSGPPVSTPSGDYVLFEHGVVAEPAGSMTPYMIGGVPQCSDTQCASGTPDATCSCNASRVNGALASTWFNDTSANKYPSSGTREYSLGVCTSSGSGERSFLFDGSPDGSGNSTTYIVGDNSDFVYEILGTERTAWESADCATQTALGLPLTNEMPFTLTSGTGATHQEFEGGTITSAPATTPIETFEHGPTTVLNMAATLAPAEPNTNSCTNGPPIPYTGSDGMPGTYYFHCTGAGHAGPGASLGSGWFDGVTLDTGGGAEYAISGETLGYWLSQGSDQSVASAIAANPPPYYFTHWAFDGNGVMAYPDDGSGSSPCAPVHYYWHDVCSTSMDVEPFLCLNDTDATFTNRYTTPDGSYTSGSNYAATDPQSNLIPQADNEFTIGSDSGVPLACGDYNCIGATYGDPPQSPEECVWLSTDRTSRHPRRLTLTIKVDPNYTRWTPEGGVFAKLGESSTGQDTGNFTWLDTAGPFPPFQPGSTNTFDLETDVSDISSIPEIRIGNTDTKIPLCITDVTLDVDDDGQLNGGDLCRMDGATPGCTGGTAGNGARNPELFHEHFTNCVSTKNADMNTDYNDPNSVVISGFDLRSSSTADCSPSADCWTYQVQHWNSVKNFFGPYQHFNGFGDYADLASYFTAKIITSFKKNPFISGGHMDHSQPQPLQLTASGTGDLTLHFDAKVVADGWGGSSVTGDAVITNYCYDDGKTSAAINVDNGWFHIWLGISISMGDFGLGSISLPQLPAGQYSWVPNAPNTPPTETSPALGFKLGGACSCFCKSNGKCDGTGPSCPKEQ